MTDNLHSTARRKKSLDDNLIPLINVVFLMLIFFLIAGKITASEPKDFQLPESAKKLAGETSRAAVVLHVLTAENYLLDGEPLAESALVSKLKSIARGDNSNAKLTLKANAELTAESLQYALLLIKNSGFLSVDLLLERVNHAE